jgi:inhibitor of KinA sporulation pathway (predicted exonuclease)
MVDDQASFTEVLGHFHDWLRDEGVLDSTSLFVTCGDWDLGVMFPAQCRLSHVEPSPIFKEWVNVKKSYHSSMGYFPRGLTSMLKGDKVPCEHLDDHAAKSPT